MRKQMTHREGLGTQVSPTIRRLGEPIGVFEMLVVGCGLPERRIGHSRDGLTLEVDIIHSGLGRRDRSGEDIVNGQVEDLRGRTVGHGTFAGTVDGWDHR